LTIKPGGHIAIVDKPFVRYWKSCPESSLSPNRVGRNLDGASITHQ
jgi:hypothetical protein